jgi:hypothetical protein
MIHFVVFNRQCVKTSFLHSVLSDIKVITCLIAELKMFTKFKLFFTKKLAKRQKRDNDADIC